MPGFGGLAEADRMLRLARAFEESKGGQLSLRKLSEKHGATYFSLHRYASGNASPLQKAPKKCDAKPRLSPDEEKVIKDAVDEFERNNTPLRASGVCELA